MQMQMQMQMQMETMKDKPLFLFLIFIFCALISASTAKSTIEPCTGSDACHALVGYTLYADLKVSELGSLFQVDPIAIMAANSIDISAPSVPNHILPAGLFLAIPVLCSCSDGIRRSVSTRYSTHPSDTLRSISSSIFSGLVSPDQIATFNSLSSSDPDASMGVGTQLVIPLPCACFNGTDNGMPTVYLSYLVREGETVAGIARRWETTVTDLMNVNGLGTDNVKDGDIIEIPLPACASRFPSYASDFGLIVANGSYAITADHCVQCSCGPGNLNLYCTPASLSVSCSSMQCSNSNLMLGNVTSQSTSAGCNVTSCSYGGFVNGTIITTLSTSLQPQCPGAHQFPALIPPPTEAIHESFPGPSPSPVPGHSGGAVTPPRTSLPGTFTLPGASPAFGPSGSISPAISLAVNPLSRIAFMCILFLIF